jgi:drug/metabolite transporter (DMT)-like permease
VESISFAIALAIAAALGWSILDLLRRFLAEHLPALPLVALVTLGAIPPLVVWLALSGTQPASRGYLPLAAGSVALNLAANFAYFRSLQLSPLSKTLPMLSFTPAFAAVLGAIFLGERLLPRELAGLAAVVVGAFLLTLRPGRGFAGFAEGLAEERGARWMIGVAFLWSATLLLDKEALAYASPQLHALVLNAGVAAGALAALTLRGEIGQMTRIRGHFALLAGAVLVSAAALGAQLVALGRVPLGYLETVKRGLGGALAVAWGRLFFAEPVTAAKLGAVALMTVGVGLLVL